MQNNYKGFSLFRDVDDIALRTFNRARVLTNIAEDNTKEERITPRGASLILGYFAQVDMNEREAVEKEFRKQMKNSGFKVEA